MGIVKIFNGGEERCRKGPGERLGRCIYLVSHCLGLESRGDEKDLVTFTGERDHSNSSRTRYIYIYIHNKLKVLFIYVSHISLQIKSPS